MQANLPGDLRQSLATIEGFRWLQPHRGELASSRLPIDVLVEDPLLLRVEAPAFDPPARLPALERSHELGGNLRYAGNGRERSLVADTRAEPPAPLSRSMEALVADIEAASAGGRPARADSAATPDAAATEDDVQALLERLGGADAVVRREDGWELRLRLGAAKVAVRVSTDASSGGWRLHHRVLRDAAGRPAAEAIADWALRVNAERALARYALDGGDLVAEARLRPDQCALDGEPAVAGWIPAVAWAVAALSERARAPLRLLTREPRVAASYARLLLTSDPLEPIPAARLGAGCDPR